MTKLNSDLFEDLMSIIDHALCGIAGRHMYSEDEKSRTYFNCEFAKIQKVRTQLMNLQKKLSEENENIITECYNEKGLIPAVKLYRSLTGMSLKDSKAQTEEIVQKAINSIDKSE